MASPNESSPISSRNLVCFDLSSPRLPAEIRALIIKLTMEIERFIPVREDKSQIIPVPDRYHGFINHYKYIPLCKPSLLLSVNFEFRTQAKASFSPLQPSVPGEEHKDILFHPLYHTIWPQGSDVNTEIWHLEEAVPSGIVVHRVATPWSKIGIMIMSCVYWETTFGHMDSRVDGHNPPRLLDLMDLMHYFDILGTEELVLLVETPLSFTPEGNEDECRAFKLDSRYSPRELLLTERAEIVLKAMGGGEYPVDWDHFGESLMRFVDEKRQEILKYNEDHEKEYYADSVTDPWVVPRITFWEIRRAG